MADASELCRTCLKGGGTISLFTDVYKPSLADMMFDCISLKIERNGLQGLPGKLCPACAERLVSCHSFWRLCWDSDARLKYLNETRLPKEKCSKSPEACTLYNPEDVGDRKIGKLEDYFPTKQKLDILEENEKCDYLDEEDMNISLSALVRRVKNYGTQGDVARSTPSRGTGEQIESSTIKNKKRRKAKKSKECWFEATTKKLEHSKETPIGRDKDIKELYYSDDFQFSVKKKQKKKRRLTQYMCEACGYRANDASSLRVHVRFHTGERPFACSHQDCTKRFVVAAALRAHERRHSGGAGCVCESCGRACASLASLRAHQRRHGPPPPPAPHAPPRTLRSHACQMCSKTFATSSDLKGHVRSHTGERPHACPVCPSRFSLRSNLAVHLRSHRGQRDHVCTHCGKAFVHKSSLKSHWRVHTGAREHVCTTCDARFAHQSSLRVHRLTHGPARRYSCSECPKSFSRISSLKVHKKRHEEISSNIFQDKETLKGDLTRNPTNKNNHNEANDKDLNAEYLQIKTKQMTIEKIESDLRKTKEDSLKIQTIALVDSTKNHPNPIMHDFSSISDASTSVLAKLNKCDPSSSPRPTLSTLNVCNSFLPLQAAPESRLGRKHLS